MAKAKDPDKIRTSLREELQKVYENHGRLTPDVVLQEARDPNHPLHARFEWSDSLAAEAWRRAQAHELIRSVKVVYRRPESNEKVQIREWHSIASSQGYVYEPLERIAEDPLLQKIVLRDAERQWRDLHSRYGHLQEWLILVQHDLADTGS